MLLIFKRELSSLATRLAIFTCPESVKNAASRPSGEMVERTRWSHQGMLDLHLEEEEEEQEELEEKVEVGKGREAM